MPQDINDSFKLAAPRLLNAWSSKIVSGVSVPYSSISEANTAIPLSFRARGLSVFIDPGTGLDEYWYRNGTANTDLILKVTGSGGGGGGSQTLAQILAASSDAGNGNITNAGTLEANVHVIKNTGSPASTSKAQLVYENGGEAGGITRKIKLPVGADVTLAATVDLPNFTAGPGIIFSGTYPNIEISAVGGGSGDNIDFGFIN